MGLIKNLYQRFAVRRVFTRWADTYEEDVTRNHYSAARAVAGAIKPYLRNEITITDLGIGTGLIWADLDIPEDAEVTGLDVSADMLTQASSHPAIGPLYLCDAGRDVWPVEDESRHLIVSAGLFEYLDETMARHVFNEARRTLQPGGRLIATYIPGATNHAEMWEGKSGDILSYRYDPAWMEQRQGFSLIDHAPPFAGSTFENGSSYDYRLITLQKI